ncbi:MAG: hypothetical protein K0Q52_82 [Microbacterium sp.]|nr:hypothetical protein [Microbacterium sp.]
MTGWRVGDAVAFEQMRQLSAMLTSRLIVDDPTRAFEVRRQTLLVDGFDRASIDERSRELAALLQAVLAE